MKKGDHVEIVLSFLADSAGAIPVAGAFVTAIMNAGINVRQKKQSDKIKKFIVELSEQVNNIEEKFSILVNDEQFAYHFYKLIYKIRDTYSSDEFKVYLNFIKSYFEKVDLAHTEQVLIFETISNLNPVCFKIIKEIYEKNGRQVFASAKYFLNSETERGVKLDEIEDSIFYSVIKLIDNNLLIKSHPGARFGESTDYIDVFLQVSSLGEKIIKLIIS